MKTSKQVTLGDKIRILYRRGVNDDCFTSDMIKYVDSIMTVTYKGLIGVLVKEDNQRWVWGYNCFEIVTPLEHETLKIRKEIGL